MKDAIRRVDYFSVEVPDRPGEAFRVLQALVSAGINLLVCNAQKEGERARINVVPDDPSLFKAAAAQAGLVFMATRSGFLIQGNDRPGALAHHLRILANAGVNLAGIDAIGSGGGRFGAILWLYPEDLTRAERALGGLQS
jgi:hypothetical protein